MDAVQARYQKWLCDDTLLCQMYVFFVKHRLQDIHDPLTHTLVLMATTPIQFVLCESGVMPFKTPNLPVYPFTDMTYQQRVDIAGILSDVPYRRISESVEGCGKISVTVSLPSLTFVDKLLVMRAFVQAVMIGPQSICTSDDRIPQRFCKIIFQRFMSSVSVSATHTSEILHLIDRMYSEAMLPVAGPSPSSTLLTAGI